MPNDRRDQAKKILEQLVEIARGAINSRDDLEKTETYVRYVPFNVKRESDGRVTGFQGSKNYVERPSWIPIRIWMSTAFEKTQEYQRTVASLSKMFEINAHQVEQWLSSFLVKHLSDKSPNDVDFILDDLEGKPCLWDVTVEMIGVLPEKRIQLAVGIMLRPVIDSDLVFENPLGNIVPFGGWDHMRNPDSIIEILMVSPNPNAVQEKVYKLCTLLCLFKETCANYRRYRMRPNSFSQFGGTLSSGGGNQTTEPHVVIRADEAADLANFIQNFEQRIPQSVFSGNPLEPLEISLKRYLDSVRGNLPTEERLTYAVMGLEALFLENEGELRFRLALRVSQLLKYLGEDPALVFSRVSEAYKFRSSHVHGFVLTNEERTGAQEALRDTWRYLRKTILFWMAKSISSGANKKKFLQEIDTMLIQDSTRQDFGEAVAKARSLMKGAI